MSRDKLIAQIKNLKATIDANIESLERLVAQAQEWSESDNEGLKSQVEVLEVIIEQMADQAIKMLDEYVKLLEIAFG